MRGRRPTRRRFASTTSSPAAARSSPAVSTEAVQLRVRSRLRARAASRGGPASCSTPAWLRSDSAVNLLGTYTFDNLDAYARGPPEQLFAAHRQPEPLVPVLPGSFLSAGRHPSEEEPDAERRRPLRGADARQRQGERRTAGRAHLGSVQERQYDPPRKRRHFLRLAAGQHLRTVAARRWLPPAGGEHPEPGVPGSGQPRAGLADQSLHPDRHL